MLPWSGRRTSSPRRKRASAWRSGKLDEEDYRSLKGELTAEALAALEADEQARSGTVSGAAAAALEAEIAEARAGLRSGAVCSDCGFANEPGSRFCSSCGHVLHGVPAA